MADYEFKYSPLTGRLTGNQMIEQTEQAINQLASLVDEAAGQVNIISTLANEANENAANALAVAEEALATTGRTYITVSTQADANDYYDSQLIYIADSTSTNIPVADTGMLEAKTNDNKTVCEQCFMADSSGEAYYRNGAITAETVGDTTTYTVAWGSWSSEPASIDYVQGELLNYLPVSGGSVTGDIDITGDLSVSGTITGNLTGNVTGTATNATNDGNGDEISTTYLPLAGGTMTGAITAPTNFVSRGVDDDYLTLVGGSDEDSGAVIALSGKDRSTHEGWFQLYAKDGSNTKALAGSPDGSLKWDGNQVGLQVNTNKFVSLGANQSVTFSMGGVPCICTIIAKRSGNYAIHIVDYWDAPAAAVNVGNPITVTHSTNSSNVTVKNNTAAAMVVQIIMSQIAW